MTISLRKFSVILLIFVFAAEVSAQAGALKAGEKIKSKISGRQIQNYSLALKKGEFARLDIFQKGADIIAKVFDSENRQILERDTPNGANGLETISFIAPIQGSYRVEIKSLEENSKSGFYEIDFAAHRQPEQRDLLQIEAEQNFDKAIKLRAENTPESNRQAEIEFEKSLANWQKLNSKYREALTLTQIAYVSYQNGNGEKSLETLNRALIKARENGDFFQIFEILHSFGDIYSALKNSEKTIEFYNQAAEFASLNKDFERQAAALQSAAYFYSEAEDFPKAIEIYEKIILIAESVKNQNLEALILNQIGVQYSKAKNKKAFEYYKRAANLYANLKDAKGESLAWSNLGIEFYNAGDSAKALEFHKQALELRRKENLKDSVIESLREIAAIYKNRDKNEYINTQEDLLKIFRETGEKSEQANSLNEIGLMSDNLGNGEKSLVYFEESLKIYRQIEDKESTASVLRNIALQYEKLKQNEKAEDYLRQSVAVRKELNDLARAADGLRELAAIYEELKNPDKEIAALKESAAIYRELKDELNEAKILNFIGIVYSEAYKEKRDKATAEKAIENFRKGLMLARNQKDDYLEARLLNNIGTSYIESKNYTKALENLQTALPIWQKLNSVKDQAETLRIIGISYTELNLAPKGIEFLLKSLEFHKTLNESDNRAAVYNNLGVAYESEENFAEALKYYRLSLQDYVQAKDKSGEMTIYGNMSNIFRILGDRDNSIDYALKRWEIAKESENFQEQVDALIQLADVAEKAGLKDEGKNFLYKAWKISQEKNAEFSAKAALTFGMLMLNADNTPEDKKLIEKLLAAGLYRAQKEGDLEIQGNYLQALAKTAYVYKDYEKSLEYMQKAFLPVQQSGNARLQASIFGNFMYLLKTQNKSQPAILYGKQAINILQKVRYKLKDLDKDLQKSFLTSNENIYRLLADLLIAQGRLPEAQQVLDLLKEEELSEFVRRDGGETDVLSKDVSLTEGERNSLNEYTKISDRLIALGTKFQELQDKRSKAGGKLADAEEAEYVSLKTQIENANEGLKKFLQTQIAEFSKKVEDDAIVTPKSIETLRADLRRAGNDVVLISTYLLPERYRAIVTTGRTMVDRKVEYKDAKLMGEDINKKILMFQQILQKPNLDPRPLGKELYDIFVKPLEKDLEGAKAKTILWSLDGSLRYIPIAALSPDGKTYLAEKYQNVIVTLARQTNLFAKPSGDEWQVLGAGVSKKYGNFSELPAVPLELASIVRENSPVSKGILNGKRLLNEEFNLDAFRNSLTQENESGKPYNVVHLATHFKLGITNQDSALLLGDGSNLTLYDAGKDEAIDFKDVELLTLSACETGVSIGNKNTDGREVESLGMLAQQKGAKSVMATLWKVADESTQAFMVNFYKLRKENPQISKAEAVRQTQIAMLQGNTQTQTRQEERRSEPVETAEDKKFPAPPFKFDENKPFAHPYFWSPFILIGNWR